MEATITAFHEEAPGRNDWAAVARIAASCDSFHPDEEDEQVADDLLSCYNCRYRRWTVVSFSCCKGKQIQH
ncbi:MAG: hypothetical protein WC007_18815 [Pelobacteraceae bacterium]